MNKLVKDIKEMNRTNKLIINFQFLKVKIIKNTKNCYSLFIININDIVIDKSLFLNIQNLLSDLHLFLRSNISQSQFKNKMVYLKGVK